MQQGVVVLAITKNEITGVDADTAELMLVYAESIAPCIQTLEEPAKAKAITVIRAVARAAIERGPRHIRSEGANGANASYTDVKSWFDDDSRSALRALCSAASTTKPPGLPVGHFPIDRPVSRLWPERY